MQSRELPLAVRASLENRGLHVLRTLSFGLSNIVLEVIDKTNVHYVAKYYPRDSFKKGRERGFFSLARGIIPVPEIIAEDDKYLLLEFLPGVSGAQLFSEDGRHSGSVGRQIGSLLRVTHAIPVDGATFGFLSDSSLSATEYQDTASTIISNTEFLQSLIREQYSKIEQYNVRIASYTFKTLTSGDSERVLVHHDVCPKNFLFVDGIITGVLDAEYALIGSPLFDIAKVHILGTYFAYHTNGVGRHFDYVSYLAGFREGYGKAATAEELQPFLVYVLLNYILFWISNPLADTKLREQILPVHIQNLQRVINGEDILVPPFQD